MSAPTANKKVRGQADLVKHFDAKYTPLLTTLLFCGAFAAFLLAMSWIAIYFSGVAR